MSGVKKEVQAWQGVHQPLQLPTHTDNCGHTCRNSNVPVDLDLLFHAWWHDCCYLCGNLAVAWLDLVVDADDDLPAVRVRQ